MKTKLYVWWVKLQANHLPWTKLYKYRIREWDNMKWQHKFLNGFWAGEGHKGMLRKNDDKQP